jgi:hypothetical protein
VNELEARHLLGIVGGCLIPVEAQVMDEGYVSYIPAATYCYVFVYQRSFERTPSGR